MKNVTKLLVAASGISIAMVGANPAFAAGTTAGSSITNNVTVSYEVGGVAQNNVTASDTFVVDRAINIVVAEEGNATTTVSPGGQDQVTTFLVTNASNDTLDVRLTAAQLAGGTAAHGGTDNFDVNNVQIYVDTNNDGIFDAGVDTLVTFLDEMTEDETRRVFIVADIPLGQATGDVAGVELTGTAREGGTAATEGAAISETVGGNTAAEDTVFADADGTFDGSSTDGDDYTVQAADLSALKESFIISDPVNGTTDPHFIPGATAEYCIAVSNAAGGSAATNVNISDPVPANTTFVPGSIIVGGTAVIDDNGTPGNTTDDTITSCSGGSPGGTFAANTVTASLGTVAAGTNETVVFRVTVD